MIRSLLVLFFFVSVSCSKNKHLPYVVHLPQVHSTDNGLWESVEDNLSLTQQIIESQLEILHILLQHQPAAVFVEAYILFVTRSDLSHFYLQDVQEHFRGAIPTSESELTETQRQILYEFGAPSVALALGSISKIHPTSDYQFEASILARLKQLISAPQAEGIYFLEDAEVKNLIFDMREQKALEKIKQYVEINKPTAQIFLIYGALHYFSPFDSKLPFIVLRKMGSCSELLVSKLGFNSKL